MGEGLIDGCGVGGVFQSPSAEQIYNIAKEVEAGAGDSFATAFLLSWRQSQLEHGDQMSHDLRAQLLEEALLKAAEFSAKTCLVYGAFGNGKAYDPEQD